MVPSIVSLLLLICLVNVNVGIEDSTSSKVDTATPTMTSNQSTAIQHTKVTNRRSTPERLLYITSGPDDYYEDDDEDPAISPSPPAPSEPCPYNRCAHLSPTCEEIQSKTIGSCLCPGIDGPNIKPDPPQLRQVLPGAREVTLNWCSPSSTVHSYRVLYQGIDGSAETGPVLNSSHRSYHIANLLPATEYTVCVVAMNNAGESAAEINEAAEGAEGSTTGPCRAIHTTASKMSPVYIGIGVGLGALVIVMGVLGILLCNRKKRKDRMNVENENEMGITNHSFKAMNTH